ncbi:hypothetical protein GCM10010123_01810 [Pilimelia anulata]|uniref:Thiopeptide-type bacteriocin biosynthesis domain-containing protein n=1 Tax=Pilimelia anulata TaxID=53371 RepID=A0A8J3B3C5_9ACTN|nr:thiopeptide-type bacteriocin biosynthesis protein [Pilimelia anulata]GGJ75448.1 hypothetical protein GCM10010123_01810 [Pilimelia anulata]
MTEPHWQQISVEFPTWAHAERTAVTDLAPALTALEAQRVLDAWFFIRKAPCWRLRYTGSDPDRAREKMRGALTPLLAQRQILSATAVVYEPEVHAFGGHESMDAAHRFWHLDSRHILAALAQPAIGRKRRELAVLLVTAMLHAARLDWYEQGDVWARVAAHRPPPTDPEGLALLIGQTRRLLAADTATLTQSNKPLADLAEWATVYIDFGHQISALNNAGNLHRGQRDILAHHIVFAFNRLGLPANAQSALSNAAKHAIFNNFNTPTERLEPGGHPQPHTVNGNLA